MKRIVVLLSLLFLTVVVERLMAEEQAIAAQTLQAQALQKGASMDICASVDCRQCCSENIFMGDTTACCRCCGDCLLHYGNHQCDDWPI